MLDHRIFGKHQREAATVYVVERVSGQRIHTKLPVGADTE